MRFITISVILVVYFNILAVEIKAQIGADSLTFKLAAIAGTVDEKFIVKPGQNAPDVDIGKIINYTKQSTKISDFQGRLLILDFWHQWCSDCIAAFPFLDSLQNAFGEKIMILPVTFQSEKSAKSFYSFMQKKNREIKLPTIVEDTLLNKIFPHSGCPHEVWINGDGKVIAVTNGKYISFENIRVALSGMGLDFPDYTLKLYEPNKPLLLSENGGNDSGFIFRSVISEGIPGIGTFPFYQNSSLKWKKIVVTNSTVLDMYKEVYSRMYPKLLTRKFLDPFNKKTIIETGVMQKNIKTILPQKTVIRLAHLQNEQQNYCYELIVPEIFSFQEAYKIMIQDLDRYFGVRSTVAKRKITCYKIVKLTDEQHINNEQVESFEKNRPYTEKKNNIQYKTIDDVVDYLNNAEQAFKHFPLFIKDSGINKTINLPASSFNTIIALRDFQEKLNRFGLSLKKGEEYVNILLLRTMN